MARAFPIVYVPDVQRSAAFYAGRLGFHEIFRMPPGDDAGYIGLELDDSRLGIVDESWPAERIGAHRGDGPRFELWVYVDDVDETVAQLREAGVPVAGRARGHAVGRAHGLRQRSGRKPDSAGRSPARLTQGVRGRWPARARARA